MQDKCRNHQWCGTRGVVLSEVCTWCFDRGVAGGAAVTARLYHQGLRLDLRIRDRFRSGI